MDASGLMIALLYPSCNVVITCFIVSKKFLILSIGKHYYSILAYGFYPSDFYILYLHEHNVQIFTHVHVTLFSDIQHHLLKFGKRNQYFHFTFANKSVLCKFLASFFPIPSSSPCHGWLLWSQQLKVRSTLVPQPFRQAQNMYFSISIYSRHW